MSSATEESNNERLQRVDVEFGPEVFKVTVRQLEGSERDAVWTDALRTAPQLREIQEKTSRQIPVLLLTRITDGA
jgi:hypothetical protein